MNATSFADYVYAHAGYAPVYEVDELVRLPPVVDADALPPGFEEVLEVQVLAYRQEMATVNGERRRVLVPVWTLVPRDR
jgi:hypothetical protein